MAKKAVEAKPVKKAKSRSRAKAIRRPKAYAVKDALTGETYIISKAARERSLVALALRRPTTELAKRQEAALKAAKPVE